MSKDRPRKEKCCNLYEKVIVNTEVEFKGLGREMLEAIKTEAKIEVLEEVKRWSLEPTTGGWIPLSEMNGTLLLQLEEMLSKLKKKKK